MTDRREYATVLADLQRELKRVDLIARRIIRRAPAHGPRRPVESPSLIDLDALDMQERAQETVRQVAARIGLWGGWRTLLPRMLTRLTDLTALAGSERDLASLQAEVLRLRSWLDADHVDGSLAGICPRCHAPVNQPAGGLWVCSAGCGWASLTDTEARRALGEAYGRLHVTLTPAGASRWIRDNLGERVPRNTVSTWLRRGQLPGAEPEGDGYWRIPIRALAERVSRHAQAKRQ